MLLCTYQKKRLSEIFSPGANFLHVFPCFVCIAITKIRDFKRFCEKIKGNLRLDHGGRRSARFNEKGRHPRVPANFYVWFQLAAWAASFTKTTAV